MFIGIANVFRIRNQVHSNYVSETDAQIIPTQGEFESETTFALGFTPVVPASVADHVRVVGLTYLDSDPTVFLRFVLDLD